MGSDFGQRHESVILRNAFAQCRIGRGTQVVRERSAKPLCVGSIPTRASKLSCNSRKNLSECHRSGAKTLGTALFLASILILRSS